MVYWLVLAFLSTQHLTLPRYNLTAKQ